MLPFDLVPLRHAEPFIHGIISPRLTREPSIYDYWEKAIFVSLCRPEEMSMMSRHIGLDRQNRLKK